MDEKKFYCADLQGGLWLQYQTPTNTWLAKPCCLFKKSYEVKQDLAAEFWELPEIQKIRLDNLQGHPLPEACIVCSRTEENGNYSRRNSWNDRLGTEWKMPDSVIELDIQLDFACNLACRICGPALSTYWRLVDPEVDPKKFKVRVKNQNALELLETMPLHDIRQIHFQGGEPFLTKTHQQVLEMLSDRMDISDTVVWYHTNGTCRADPDLLDLWQKFKRLEIYFSIDDMGSRMEYQRWPVKWNQLEENLLWWKENLPCNALLNVERTIGVLNASWITEFDDWAKQNFSHSRWEDTINICYHYCSGVYSLDCVSQEYKDHVLQNIPDTHWVHKTFCSLDVDDGKKIEKMISHLNKHDIVRKHNWQDVYPEFKIWYKRYL